MHYEEIVKSTCEDALQFVSPWTQVERKSQNLCSPANNTIVIIMIRCTSVPARVRAAAQRLEQKQRRQSWRWWSGWQWCWWQGGWWRSWQGRRWWWRQGWRWLWLRWWRWWDEKLFLKGWRAPSSIVGGVKEGETSSCTWGKEHQGEVTITTCISFAGARHNHLINNTKNKIRSQNQQNHHHHNHHQPHPGSSSWSWQKKDWFQTNCNNLQLCREIPIQYFISKWSKPKGRGTIKFTSQSASLLLYLLQHRPASDNMIKMQPLITRALLQSLPRA